MDSPSIKKRKKTDSEDNNGFYVKLDFKSHFYNFSDNDLYNLNIFESAITSDPTNLYPIIVNTLTNYFQICTGTDIDLVKHLYCKGGVPVLTKLDNNTIVTNKSLLLYDYDNTEYVINKDLKKDSFFTALLNLDFNNISNKESSRDNKLKICPRLIQLYSISTNINNTDTVTLLSLFSDNDASAICNCNHTDNIDNDATIATSDNNTKPIDIDKIDTTEIDNIILDKLKPILQSYKSNLLSTITSNPNILGPYTDNVQVSRLKHKVSSLTSELYMSKSQLQKYKKYNSKLTSKIELLLKIMENNSSFSSDGGNSSLVNQINKQEK